LYTKYKNINLLREVNINNEKLMNNTKFVITTVTVVLVVIVVAIILRPSPSPDTILLDELEHRLNELEQQVAKLDPKISDTKLATGIRKMQIKNEDDPEETEEVKEEVMVRLQQVEDTVARADQTLSAAIKERVEEVVGEKVDELEKKQDKKPTLTVFSEMLELTDDQRRVVDKEVWSAQKEVRTILETPTEDGSILIDELVDVIAYGEAKHPEAGSRFIKWLGRVMTEKIPGTDVTYGADIEVIKNNTRSAFRSEFTEEQYAEFESWGVDPTEIKEIENSPWADLEERVKQRLLELAE